jgi:hypothetical protein
MHVCYSYDAVTIRQVNCECDIRDTVRHNEK